MSAVLDSSLEPIAVTWRLSPTDPATDQLGETMKFELIDTGGRHLASIRLSIDELAKLIMPHLQTDFEISLSGEITADSEVVAKPPPANRTDLFELIKDALDPLMLEDESDAKGQLATLRHRLSDAIGLVDKVLADLGDSIA